MLEYSRWSSARIATPPTTTMTSVVATSTLAALRTDTGSRRNRDNRRSIRFTRGSLGMTQLSRRARTVRRHFAAIARALSASNSAWLIAPLSSRPFAVAISAAGPPRSVATVLT
jgi:hypothetical protein